jgi:hypothetical protein
MHRMEARRGTDRHNRMRAGNVERANAKEAHKLFEVIADAVIRFCGICRTIFRDWDPPCESSMNESDWHLSVAHFLLPKAGLLSSECEDAIALSHG